MSSADQEPARTVATAPRRVWPIALLGAIIALIVLGYVGVHWLLMPRADAVFARLATIEQQQRETQTQTAALARRTDQLEQHGTAVAGDFDQLRTEQAKVTQALQTLMERANTADQEGVLAEVEYLIELATQRLTLTRDINTARAALAAADARLAQTNGSTASALRAQLGVDLAALAAVAEPDVAGVALNLAGIGARLDSLPRKPVLTSAPGFVQTRAEPIAFDNWRGLARAVWRDLLSLVEVKDTTNADDVAIDPRLGNFVQQAMHLEIAGARLALFARDAANVRADLDLLSSQLERYYDGEDATVKAALATLVQVRALDLTPPVPSLEASRALVHHLRQAEPVTTPP